MPKTGKTLSPRKLGLGTGATFRSRQECRCDCLLLPEVASHIRLVDRAVFCLSIDNSSCIGLCLACSNFEKIPFRWRSSQDRQASENHATSHASQASPRVCASIIALALRPWRFGIYAMSILFPLRMGTWMATSLTEFLSFFLAAESRIPFYCVLV